MVDKLLQTFHHNHCFSNSHPLLQTHSEDISPHTSPTKPKHSRAPRSRKQFPVFSPIKSGGWGSGGPSGPLRKQQGEGVARLTPGSPSPARPDVGCLIFLQFCFNTHTILGAGSLSHFLQGIALPLQIFPASVQTVLKPSLAAGSVKSEEGFVQGKFSL